jgi:pentalenolactone synthase
MASGASIVRATTPGGDPAWLVTGYDAVRTLLGDDRLGRTHPEPERGGRFSDSVIFGQPAGDPFSQPENHQQLRRLLTASFSAKRMSGLRPRVQAIVDGLLDEMARRTPPVDLHEAVSFPVPALVICELLGVPYEDRADFRRWSDEVGRLDDRARSEAAQAALRAYVGGLAERKREQPADDVISDLVAASERDPATVPPELVPQVAGNLLFAGHETTVTAIDKGVILLLANEGLREAVVGDPNALHPAVEEVLRVPHPVGSQRTMSAFGLPRYASEDIDFGGVTIARGEMVMLSLQSANVDDEAFPAPRELDLTRDGSPHLTFGFGAHFCLGAPLARMELQTVFGTLFRRFPTLRLAVAADELRQRRGTLTGGVMELPVAW